MDVLFIWDQRKAAANVAKHKLSFDEAVTAFADRLAKVFEDDEHSTHESRELLVGYSLAGRLVVVSFTEEREGIVRLISARPATPQERRRHEEAT